MGLLWWLLLFRDIERALDKVDQHGEALGSCLVTDHSEGTSSVDTSEGNVLQSVEVVLDGERFTSLCHHGVDKSE